MTDKTRWIIVLVVSVLVGLSIVCCLAVFMGRLSGRWTDRVIDWRRGSGSDWASRTYASNGDKIYFMGINDAGERIRFSGGPSWLVSKGGGCVVCHGDDGLRYATLVGSSGRSGERRTPYTDDTIKRAITAGLDADGRSLSGDMPRWRMSDRDLNAVIGVLKSSDKSD